jgi:outer membrane protein TolC
MRLLTFAALGAAAFLNFASALAAGHVHDWLPDGAFSMLMIVQTNNPQIASARLLQIGEWERARAYDGFYEPSVSVSAGGSQGPIAAPESAMGARIVGDAASVQAGLLVPLRAGAYLGIGASQRRLFEVDGHDDLGQTAAGVRLEVPLLQNRTFRIQQMGQAAMDATADGAEARARSVEQQILRGSLLLYAHWLFAAADVRESMKAADRVDRLLQETSGRVELKTVAEYQVFAAKMEVSFRQEELRQSRSVLTQARQSLETAMGGVPVDERTGNPALLRSWAMLCATTDVVRVLEQALERPERIESMQAITAAERRHDAAREALRSHLSLVGGVGYQAEDEDGGFGSEAILQDDRAGVEVALVWSRPLAFDAEQARVRAQRADADASRAELRRVELEIRAELARAHAAREAACDRLSIVDHAVQEANRALVAEEQRLSLGEGRSRNVLDAQKDLTAAERRANVAAFDMIIAFTDLLHAAGVPMLSPENPHDDFLASP